MANIKDYQPINGVVEPDFLEYLKETFQRWQQNFEEGVTTGTREIAKMQERVMGAKLNSRYGFEVVVHRDNDEDGQERFSLLIYKNREAVETEKPLYVFSVAIYR